MSSTTLTDDDWQWLSRYARDDLAEPAPLETLARLESLNLLMRSWGERYVITDLGRRQLRDRGIDRNS